MISRKSLVSLVFSATLALSPLSSFASAAHKKTEKHSDHKHADKCGHKGEKHGDHEDYEHDGHHHKKHGGHYDECDGPEADAAAAAAKPAAGG